MIVCVLSGVNALEVMIAHVCTEFLVMIVQVAGLLVFTLVVFGVSSQFQFHHLLMLNAGLQIIGVCDIIGISINFTFFIFGIFAISVKIFLYMKHKEHHMIITMATRNYLVHAANLHVEIMFLSYYSSFKNENHVVGDTLWQPLLPYGNCVWPI